LASIKGNIIKSPLKNLLTSSSKSQYERIFKKWGFKKYQTKEGWVAIGHEVQKREREKKESEVWWNENLIAAKRVRKETQRYASLISRIPHGTLYLALAKRLQLITQKMLQAQFFPLESSSAAPDE
jgi:hypothetical protein